MTQQKHFLDSSVVRPYLFGGSKYKQYLREQFGDERLYISEYVRMEIIRGYLIPLLNFYFVLDMPQIATVSDAISDINNSFKIREQKALLQFLVNLFAARHVDLNEMRDKAKALRYLADYIKRIELHLHQAFRNISTNATHCARCHANFGDDPLSEKDQLTRFVNTFQDKLICRARCHIDRFIVQRQATQVGQLIGYGKELTPRTSAENKGFLQLVDQLEGIMADQGRTCTCDRCAKIGDAVIALESPPDMQVEHTDHAFDHLCKVLVKPHQKHLPEQRVNRSET